MSGYGPRVNGATPGGSSVPGASCAVYTGLISMPLSVSRRSVAATRRRLLRGPRRRLAGSWQRSGRRYDGGVGVPPLHEPLNQEPQPPDTQPMEPWSEADRGYEPIHPRGTDWRGILRKIFAPVLVVLGLGA